MRATHISCSSCGKVIAREDRRRTRQGTLVPLSGTKLETSAKQAPRLICPCGKITVLLQGSL